MRLLKPVIIICFSFFVMESCKQGKTVINPADYERFLQSKGSVKLAAIDEEMSFWSARLKRNNEDLAAQSKIASLLTRRFSYSGNIAEIHQADSLYHVVNQLNKFFSSATYRSLASNCITQHKFKQAAAYIDTALINGDDLYHSKLMEADIALELGDMLRAKNTLASIKDKTDFAYLIRKAKIMDHEGKGSEAIAVLMKALETIHPETDKLNYTWAKTNLGDWLGHNNRYKESYLCYLDALKADPENYHALKGIAWLAFAHDKNITEAKRILYHLISVHPVPDYKLLMSEIADFENNLTGKNKWVNEFIKETTNPQYGDMYNKYLFELYADDKNNYDKALEIAQKEIANRPTPLSYDMMAWVFYKMNKIKEAEEIIKTKVENKCFEPTVLYHQGLIYKASGEMKKAATYLAQAYESAFELGPNLSKTLKQTLAVL